MPRVSVFEFLEDWTRLTERIGYWVDLDDPYRTLDTPYIESVWWALKQLWDRDLLYEGFKVVPYCPRDGTSLSSHEVSQGYKDVEDPSVYVTYPVTKPAGALREGDELLVWTTTPWTLVSNAAVAVDPELDLRALGRGLRAGRGAGRARARRGRGGRRSLHGRATWSARATSRRSRSSRRRSTARRATPSCPATSCPPRTAPASSTPRSRSARTTSASAPSTGLNVINPVRPDGTYDERIGPYEGVFVKDADDDLIEDLEARGRMFRSERLLHTYPHCWRCGTPLLYYAKPTWYIRMSRGQATGCWRPTRPSTGTPSTSSTGASGAGWRTTSTGRLGASATGARRCRSGATRRARRWRVGSFEELRELSGVSLEDPHRPYVDDVVIPSPTGGEPLRRVPEVIDVWFDSGSMPFAQWHAPFENQDKFDEQFPADYICEAIDQTRGWFYSLIAISTLLFDQSSYKTVPLPRPHRRSRGQEDVEVARQHRRAVGRHRPPRRGRLPLVLPDQQAAVGRLQVRRPTPSASRCASSCCSCGTRTGST